MLFYFHTNRQNIVIIIKVWAAFIFGNILKTVSCTIPDAVLALLIPINLPNILSNVQ